MGVDCRSLIRRVIYIVLLCVSRGAGGDPIDSSKPCEFGALPGRLVVNGTFPSWRIFDPQCHLQDRLSGLLRQEQRDAALGVRLVDPKQQAIKILLFGDSVEQWITRDICSHFTEGADNIMSLKDSHGHSCAGGHHWNCAGCSTNGFIIVREPSHGVLTIRTWEQEAVNSSLTLAERIPKVVPDYVTALCAVVTMAIHPARSMYVRHAAFLTPIACNTRAGDQGFQGYCWGP